MLTADVLRSESEQLTRAQPDVAGEQNLRPVLAAVLGLPPAIVITAGFDPLRDEGENYAEALRATGTASTLRRFPGFLHGFVSGAGISRSCRGALVEIAAATRATFAGLDRTRDAIDAPEPATVT